jgi:hypothetical protein
MLMMTHDFNSSTEEAIHPQGSRGNWGLEISRRVALGVHDVLPHHVFKAWEYAKN